MVNEPLHSMHASAWFEGAAGASSSKQIADRSRIFVTHHHLPPSIPTANDCMKRGVHGKRKIIPTTRASSFTLAVPQRCTLSPARFVCIIAVGSHGKRKMGRTHVR